MSDIWQTAVIAVDLVKTDGPERPDLRRYVGVSFVSTGREYRVRQATNEDAQRLPRGARIVYQTRPYRRDKRWTHAFEQARSRTIHHNLYHADNPASGHVLRWCHERENA